MAGQTTTRTKSSRGRIIEATAGLIRRQGIHVTSIADIGAESGASVGSIYHHFGNKDRIIQSLASSTLDWPIGVLASAELNWTPTVAFEMAINTLAESPEVGDLIVQLAAGAINDDTLGRALSEQFNRFAESIEMALADWADANDIPASELPTIVQVIGGLVIGHNAQRLLNREFDEEVYRQRCLRFLETLDRPCGSADCVGAAEHRSAE